MLGGAGLGVALGVVAGMMAMVPLAVTRSAGLGGARLCCASLRRAALGGTTGSGTTLSSSRNSHRRHRHGEATGNCQQRCKFHLRHSRKLPFRSPISRWQPRQQLENRQTGSHGEAPWLQSTKGKLRSFPLGWIAHTKTRTRIVTKSRCRTNSNPEPCRATLSSAVAHCCVGGLPNQPDPRR